MGYERVYQRSGEASSGSGEDDMTSRAPPRKGGEGSSPRGRAPGEAGSTEDTTLDTFTCLEETVNLFSKRETSRICAALLSPGQGGLTPALGPAAAGARRGDRSM